MDENKMALIIEENDHTANMVKEVLLSIGITQTKYISTIDEAQESILKEKFTIIITETQLEEDSTLNLINWLRKINNPNKTVPVIALTQNATKNLVSFARDIGVTEFVIKPFTNASLTSVLINALKFPRNFIITRNYSGPDRRRKNEAPPDGEEKRNVTSKRTREEKQ